ncbi:DUF3301 domain-containing protein [Vibrio ulleungensis]|uniref:DUF3301 domain-containing protein n=1 Tax=Vibrio ulleungensis TaxID=2807619 RepID=A0ABS2HPW2_9VIBR|nr:DUF3301 domain-containing protein [Vibrio ulleungensis]MBM7038147.1 DUF3301 domain-containing protein [Vibrio ulleungensis]
MMSDLLAILGVAFAAYLFWQQRKQSEFAKKAVAHHCEQHGLQLVSVAFGAHKFKKLRGSWRWYTQYQFEFSSLGDDCYQGELIMRGFHVSHFQTPPYRM